jgi:hypothetical protein
MAPATISLGQPADFTYFVNENSVSYPLFSSNDITWSKTNNNIRLNISDDYKNNLNSTYATIDVLNTFKATVTSLLTNYPTYADIADFETAVTMFSTTYQTISGMSSYVTSSQLIDKVTTATLSSTLDLYATKDLVSDIFQDKAGMGDYQTVANMSSYTTGDAVANTLTSYLTSSGATSLYQLNRQLPY